MNEAVAAVTVKVIIWACVGLLPHVCFDISAYPPFSSSPQSCLAARLSDVEASLRTILPTGVRLSGWGCEMTLEQFEDTFDVIDAEGPPMDALPVRRTGGDR